jgi:hypothetical protein
METLARRSRDADYHDEPESRARKREERQSLAIAVAFCHPAKTAADPASDAIEQVMQYRR